MSGEEKTPRQIAWINWRRKRKKERAKERFEEKLSDAKKHLAEYIKAGGIPKDLVKLPKLRIQIVEGKILLDGARVTLDQTDESIKLTLCFLEHVLDADGDWRSSGDINRIERRKPNQGFSGTRWDRVFKKLPSSISSLIESNRRKGYRLRPEAWRK